MVLIILVYLIFVFFISFMLIPAYRRLGRGNRVKTLLSPLSGEFFEALRVEWRHSMSGSCVGAIAKKMKILNISFPRVGYTRLCPTPCLASFAHI